MVSLVTFRAHWRTVPLVPCLSPLPHWSSHFPGLLSSLAPWPIMLQFPLSLADLWLRWPVSLFSQLALLSLASVDSSAFVDPSVPLIIFLIVLGILHLASTACGKIGQERHLPHPHLMNNSPMALSFQLPSLKKKKEKNQKQLRNSTFSYRLWGHRTKQSIWYEITAIQVADILVSQGKKLTQKRKQKQVRKKTKWKPPLQVF